jgi:hypothetical protein
MQIYLNTRGFEQQDYQWFSVNSDETLTISENFWDRKEVRKVPPSDEFDLTLGRFENGELFLLTSDLKSNRYDFAEREIRNSLIFISEDEIILRKLATLFLFNYEDINFEINKAIVDNRDSAYGITVKFSEIMEGISKYLDEYEVKFEFDALVESQFSKFAEISLRKSVVDDDGVESTDYFLNPIFENRVKRYLLGEVFPDKFEILFLYTPKLSLHDIEISKPYIAVANNLDKFAREIFLRDTEEWAIYQPKKSFSGNGFVSQYKFEILTVLFLGVVTIPLFLSHTNQSSKIDELSSLVATLQEDRESFRKDKIIAEKRMVEAEAKTQGLEDEILELRDEVESKDSAIISLEKKLQKELLEEETQNLRNQILTLTNNLGKCEDNFQKETIQRNKLSAGYKWYKDKFATCQEELRK